MKKLRLILSAALVLVIMLSLVACADKEVSKYPPGYEAYTSVLAMPKEEAYEKLRISESDLTEAYGIYDYTGRHVPFCGGEFDEYLELSGVEGDGYRFCGFMYECIVGNDPKAAAQVISKVAQTLTETYGPSCGIIGTPDTNRLAEKTLEELEEWLSNPGGGANVDLWSIQSLTTPDAKDFMEKIKESTRNHNRLLEDLLFYAELHVLYEEEGDITLRLSYKLEPFKHLEQQ